MNAVDFEYAVRKDVRNNPIVREVDEARQRDLWRSVGVGVLLGGLLLFSAWQHFELLRHGYRIERLQQERAAEEEINRHLTLEIETLKSPKRIESLAIQKLRMIPPGDGDAIVIERVKAPAPPDASVVARVPVAR
jgi:cell division protein FtsL